MTCDLEVDTDLIRAIAQGIGEAADRFGAAVPTAGRSGVARGSTAGSAAVREAMRAVAVAEAHSCAAVSAITARMAEIAAGLAGAARAFDAVESLCSGR